LSFSKSYSKSEGVKLLHLTIGIFYIVSEGEWKVSNVWDDRARERHSKNVKKLASRAPVDPVVRRTRGYY